MKSSRRMRPKACFRSADIRAKFYWHARPRTARPRPRAGWRRAPGRRGTRRRAARCRAQAQVVALAQRYTIESKRLRAQRLGQRRPVVLHREHRAAPRPGARRHADRRVRRARSRARCPPACRGAARRRRARPRSSTGSWRRRVSSKRARRIGRAIALDAAGDDLREVEALALGALQHAFEPRGFREARDEAREAVHAFAGAIDVDARLVAAAARALQVVERGAHHRHRRAQLVRRGAPPSPRGRRCTRAGAPAPRPSCARGRRSRRARRSA